MPASSDALNDKLSRSRELTITVTGRKSGKKISNPVWFVLDGEKLYLLPFYSSDTQWYKNVLKKPSIRIDGVMQLRNTTGDLFWNSACGEAESHG